VSSPESGGLRGAGGVGPGPGGIVDGGAGSWGGAWLSRDVNPECCGRRNGERGNQWWYRSASGMPPRRGDV